MFVLKYLISIVFVHFFHFYIVFGLKEQPNRVSIIQRKNKSCFITFVFDS